MTQIAQIWADYLRESADKHPHPAGAWTLFLRFYLMFRYARIIASPQQQLRQCPCTQRLPIRQNTSRTKAEQQIALPPLDKVAFKVTVS